MVIIIYFTSFYASIPLAIDTIYEIHILNIVFQYMGFSLARYSMSLGTLLVLLMNTRGRTELVMPSCFMATFKRAGRTTS